MRIIFCASLKPTKDLKLWCFRIDLFILKTRCRGSLQDRGRRPRPFLFFRSSPPWLSWCCLVDLKNDVCFMWPIPPKTQAGLQEGWQGQAKWARRIAGFSLKNGNWTAICIKKLRFSSPKLHKFFQVVFALQNLSRALVWANFYKFQKVWHCLHLIEFHSLCSADKT